MHRLRKVTGNLDALYQLTDIVEFYEGYFEKEVPHQTKSNLKRRRGSERQIDVAVMAESIPVEDLESGKTSNHCRHFKMKVLESHKSTEIKSLVKDSIDPEAVVFPTKAQATLILKITWRTLLQKNRINKLRQPC
jgi:hypothetical protein